MQAREKTREETACDEGSEEVHRSGRTRAKQERGGAGNVRATQRDEAGTQQARTVQVQKSRTNEKAQAACD
jgi:hypothetical protein